MQADHAMSEAIEQGDVPWLYAQEIVTCETRELKGGVGSLGDRVQGTKVVNVEEKRDGNPRNHRISARPYDQRCSSRGRADAE